MKARVNKYQENSQYMPKRSKKNEQLYNEIKEQELDHYSIESNARVISNDSKHMDIDKIKEILEKNYQETPKRRSMKIDMEEEEPLELEKTREYDINAILEKAREEKEVDYQEERLKKVRDTQYDILKNLELDKEIKPQKKTQEELLELINTINLNEYQKSHEEEVKEEKGPIDPLDIFTDLKGSDDTVVAGAKELTEEIEKIEEEKKEEQEIIEKDETIDKTFYTNSMTFNKEDFADINDESKLGNFVIKGLIVLVFIAIIVGIVLFLNDFLKLGWF